MVQSSLRFHLRLSSAIPIPIRASHLHFTRIVSGFLGGTGGFARGKCVTLKYGMSGGRERIHVCIRSDNGKVSRGRLVVVFRHFCGASRFRRKDNLNLTVSGIVVRQLSKHVGMRSRGNGKDYFAIVLSLTSTPRGRVLG